ncbi:hypothetical protein JCM10213_001590 [Rhodosporidiobolus nylandii]
MPPSPLEPPPPLPLESPPPFEPPPPPAPEPLPPEPLPEPDSPPPDPDSPPPELDPPPPDLVDPPPGAPPVGGGVPPPPSCGVVSPSVMAGTELDVEYEGPTLTVVAVTGEPATSVEIRRVEAHRLAFEVGEVGNEGGTDTC